MKVWGRVLLFLAPVAAIMSAGSCGTYGQAIWRHRIENTMAEPGSHRFAIAIISSQEREPRGIATFPDGGKPVVVRERAGLWLCGADSGQVVRLAIVERPPSFRSEFHFWIVGWEAHGDTSAIFAQMTGRAGATSDTPFYRWLFRFEASPDTGVANAVIYVP